ncbi:RibD family protein [Hymenobacter sp. BRD128]|uniref:dihydrofolate reductase family protein n=1 Tax=Hymenobacter sp. BRD128 TaxID=2675878 RepID=UPI001563A88B|nr:dihydrofolate reductase family protein [Hymenobacter sp. BRD128]QKG56652.1 RibD family protein [Hymenobacter sp. BRD128]
MPQLKKPRVICHMMTSLDGRIIVQRWGAHVPGRHEYEDTAATLGAQAWLCGRVTMEKDFTKGRRPVLPPVASPLDRADFVAPHGATAFAIAVDAHGKLGWAASSIDDHIIAVLTEQVPDAYLAYLRGLGISYVFGGAHELDFALVLEKLGRLFPISTILLEGGGHLNGSFLRAGLIDELSLLHYPLVDGASASASVFEQGPEPGPAVRFELLSSEPRRHGILWLRYRPVPAG